MPALLNATQTANSGFDWTNPMPDAIQPDWFEKEVRARSHAIWEAEGHKDGYSEEHWMRAAREIEDACRSATEGTNPLFTPPHPILSQQPIRLEEGETSSE